MIKERTLMERCAAFLDGLRGSPIPTRLWPEFEALRASLAPYLPTEENHGKDG